MNKKEFEENYIFEKYKNTSFKCCKDFKKRVEKYINIDTRDVYAKILKYQINTYGETLTEVRDSFQEKRKVNQYAQKRNKSSSKTRGTWKSAKDKRWTDYE